ncbi:hypothetical protein ES703_13697 [subsurface metagenome]
MAKSKNHLDISILIATYNRADILRQTLENMTCLDRDGLSVEFVVVDNNSSDHTKEVIESFTDRLPIRYLFGAKPGKSRALNRALDKVPLGKIIVFTDDDIVPHKDWLTAIVSISNRWPDYSVFGGKIDLIWPKGEIPSWAQQQAIWFWAFGHHDQGKSDSHYLPRNYPSGANFWVRRSTLSGGKRFDESVGPCSTNFKAMGAETSLLHQLVVDGYAAMYSPDAVVGHYVQRTLLSESNIKKRAYRWGRGMPHRRICHPTLFEKHPLMWRLLRVSSLIRHAVSYVGAMMSFSCERRIKKSLNAIVGIGHDVESIKLAWGKSESNSIRNK